MFLSCLVEIKRWENDPAFIDAPYPYLRDAVPGIVRGRYYNIKAASGNEGAR